MGPPADPVAGPAEESWRIDRGLLPRLLGYHLRRSQVALFRHFTRSVTAVEDITPGLFGMLEVIAANPGLAQSRLAEAMGVERSAIVKVVDQLEARGLIARHRTDGDRRSYSLRLTGEGRRRLSRLEERVLAHEADFTRGLAVEERSLLIRLLQRLDGSDDGAPPSARAGSDA